MAKGKGQINGWITKNGVHIPIYGEYTVRGGVEPKAKGSKFKGKKKPDKYTNPRTGKRDHVQGKTQADLNKTLKEQGLELDGAYQRAENEEKVYMYDKDGNVYSGTFNKYSDGGREIVNIERDKLNGESNVRNLDPDRDEHIRNGESKGAKREEAIKKQENERFKTAKELKAEGKWDTSEKNKYADRDWNKDVEDSKRYGYSEQTEEGKKPVTKAEEEKQARQSFIDKKAQEQGFASAKDMESYNAETGVNKETWKATPESYAQSKGKSIRDIAQEVNNNDAARAQANQLMKDGRTYDEAAALAHSDMERGTLKGQESSTPTEPYAKSNNKYLGQSVKDLNKLDVRNLNDSELSQLREHASASSRTGARGADKLWKNADAEINRRAMEKESSTQSFSPESSAKAINDMARRRAESKRKSMEAADEADAYDKQHKEGKYAEAIEYQKSGQLSKDLQTSNKALDEKWASGQGSSSSSFSPESSAQTINDMQRRRANGGGKDDDWKTAQSVLESAPAGTTMIQTGNRGVKFQYTKKEDGKWHSSAGEDYTQDSKTLSMSWRGESGPSVEFTTPDKALSNADIKASHNAATGGRLNQALGLDRNNRPIGNRSTRKVDTSTPTRTEKQDSLSASMNERSRIRGELHAKDKAMKAAIPTTVSGLRSAYADATGSMKSKIAAELRRKGYSLVGGKWVKA